VSSPYRAVLDRKLADVEGERRIYLDRLVEAIPDVPALQLKETLAYMVLAECCEELPTDLPSSRTALILGEYLDGQGRWIRQHLYTRAFVLDPGPAIATLAEGFVAAVAARVLDGVKDGWVEPDEKRPFTFSYPDYGNERFPYWDEEE